MISMKKAWLITWDQAGGHLRQKDKIVSILSGRLSAKTVFDYVERLYVNSEYSLSDRLAYAKNRKDNPYPAQFVSINGVPWEGQITCGHNPFLFARLVRNTRVEVDLNGDEQLCWEDIPKPCLSK